MNKIKKRYRPCKECSKDISERVKHAVYCKSCAIKVARRQRTEFYKRKPHYIKLKSRERMERNKEVKK